jgi:DHA2 family metal-tetracycline-proton antiporter-like MFS transporter
MLLLQAPTAGAAAGTVGAGLLLVSLPLLWAHTRRAADGFLPHAVIGNPAIRACSIGGLTLLGGYFAALLAVPSLLAETQGWSSLGIGLAMLPAAAAGAVGSRVVGRLLADGGHFRTASAVAAGSVATLLLAGFGGGSPWLLVLGVAGASIGFSGGSVALNDRVTLAADDSTLGVALGMVNMVQFVGGAIGTALLGGLSGLVPLHTALGLAAVLPTIGLAVLVRAARRDATDPSPAPAGA